MCKCRQTCTKLNTKHKLMDIEKLKLEAQSKALHIADVSGSALFSFAYLLLVAVAF